MPDALSYHGMFWFPDSPEREFWGQLSYDPDDGAHLALSSIEPGFSLPDRRLSSETILGRSVSGREITACRCRQDGATSRARGHSERAYTAECVLMGGHFPHPDEVLYQSATAVFGHLDDWITVYGLTEDDSGPGRDRTYILKHSHPPAIEATTDSGLVVQFRTSFRYSGTRRQATVTEAWSVVLRPSEPATLPTLRNWLRQVQDFLTFCVMWPCYPVSTAARLACGGSADPAHHCPVDVVDTLLRHRSPTRSLPQTRMLLPYKTVAERLPCLLRSWFQSYEVLAPVLHLYFDSSQYRELEIPLPNRFLSLTAALESYHSRKIRCRALSREEFRRRRKAVLCAIPPKLKDWVSDKLSQNYPSLKSRIRDLLCRFRPCLPSDLFPPTPEEQKRFIDEIVDARNYYSHYTRTEPSPATSPQRVLANCERIRILLTACLLTEMGFGDQETRQALNRMGRYRVWHFAE